MCVGDVSVAVYCMCVAVCGEGRATEERCRHLRVLHDWVTQIMAHSSLQSVTVAATRGLRAVLGVDTLRLFVFDPSQGDLITWSLPAGGEATPAGAIGGVGAVTSDAAGVVLGGGGGMDTGAAPGTDATAAGDGLVTQVLQPPLASVRVPIARGLLGEAFRTARPMQATHSSNQLGGAAEDDGYGEGDASRTVLCEPIVDVSGVVVGVAEVGAVAGGLCGLCDGCGTKPHVWDLRVARRVCM